MARNERNLYWVNWYRGDYCYRSTSSVDWKGVQYYKKLAKAWGERITYEKM